MVARTADGAIVRLRRWPRTCTATASSISPWCPARVDGALAGRGDGTRSGDRRRARVRRRARRRAVRRRRHGARQRAGPAPAQQRPLDARRRGDEPVRPAGARRHRGGPRWRDDDRAGGGDGQPARRPVVRRADGTAPSSRAGRRRSARPTPACTCTASATRGAAARWATSPSSATTRRPPPSGRSPCAPRSPPADPIRGTRWRTAGVSVRATERQRGSGQPRPAWPGNAVTANVRQRKPDNGVGQNGVNDARPRRCRRGPSATRRAGRGTSPARRGVRRLRGGVLRRPPRGRCR